MKSLVFIALFFSIAAFSKAAPSFKLMSSDGKEHSLSEFKDKTIVLEWYNFGCPYVRKHYDSKNMQNLQKKYTNKGVKWFSIVSSAKDKQGYLDAKSAPAIIKKESSNADLIMFDPDGKVGRMYGAKTTPHMYIIHKGELVYQGAIDDNPDYNRESIAGAKNYVADALDNILNGKKVAVNRTKAYGCSVKYQD